jgi:hypothetical protein
MALVEEGMSLSQVKTVLSSSTFDVIAKCFALTRTITRKLSALTEKALGEGAIEDIEEVLSTRQDIEVSPLSVSVCSFSGNPTLRTTNLEDGVSGR